MKFHIVKIGEPLPGEGFRLRRMSLLSNALIEKGHEVTWWTSNWSHQHLAPRNASLVDDSKALGINLRLIPAIGYRKNISIARFLHHAQFAVRLINNLKRLKREEMPDLIWVCFPTVPVALLMASWAKKNNVKLIFDIRDVSPDILVAHLPSQFRGIANLLLSPLRRLIGKALCKADGIVAVSKGYLDWAHNLMRMTTSTCQRASTIIPLGYERPVLATAVVKSSALSHALEDARLSDGLLVVYSGSLGSSYDLETAIRGFALARERRFLGRFIIAGGGSNEAIVRQLANSTEGVTYVGWLDSDDLAQLLTSADVGVMAYSVTATQGLPNKIYEYLGNSLVILSSLQGECASFIREFGIGYTYDVSDFKSFAALLVSLQTDVELLPELKQRVDKCFESGFEQSLTTATMIKFAEAIKQGNIDRV